MTDIRYGYRAPGMFCEARRLTCTWCGHEFRNQSANAKICGDCKMTDKYKEFARVRKLDAAQRSRQRAGGRNGR